MQLCSRCLSLSLAVLLLTAGCSEGESVPQEQSAEQQCRAILLELAQTGMVDSGVAVLIEQAEKLAAEDPGKQKVVDAANSLMTTRGAKAVRKKAEEILGML